jgi:DNA-binding NarL/FixJ family response regulator
MKVLVIDDHPLFCDGLALLLQAMGLAEQVASCYRADQVEDACMRTACDLVLLDWNLGSTPSSDPLRLIGTIRRVREEARIVVVSAEVTTDGVRAAVEAGAVGYVPKDATSQRLIEAIEVTSRGGIYLPHTILTGLGNRSTRENASPSDTGESRTPQTLEEAFPALTERQTAALKLATKGLSNKAIARLLDISDGTVKQHLHAAYRELGVTGRTEAVYLMSRMRLHVFD